MPLHPAQQVFADQCRHMIAQPLTDLEHGADVLPRGANHTATLVGCPRDLIEQSPDHRQFRDRALERQQLLFGEGRQAP